MKPGTQASIKAGAVGAVILSVVVLAFLLSAVLHSQINYIDSLNQPVYVLSFIIAGVLAASPAWNRIYSADYALWSGFIAGCAASVPLALAWVVLTLEGALFLYLDYWAELTVSIILLMGIGIATSAFSAVIYAYASRNFKGDAPE